MARSTAPGSFTVAGRIAASSIAPAGMVSNGILWAVGRTAKISAGSWSGWVSLRRGRLHAAGDKVSFNAGPVDRWNDRPTSDDQCLLGSTIELTWAHTSAYTSYEIWRHTSPYYELVAPPATLVASGLPPDGCTMSDDAITCTLAGGVGDPDINYFYVVRGVRSDGSGVNSNQTGELDFGLVSGWQPSPGFHDNMCTYEQDRWNKADGWGNGDIFNCGWRADHITHNSTDCEVEIRLDDQQCPGGCSGYPYASGEYRTDGFYGYGCYEARLQAAPNGGVVTSFFTYGRARMTCRGYRQSTMR